MSENRNAERDKVREMVIEALRHEVSGNPAAPNDPASVIDESLKSVITEAEIRDLAAGAKILIREGAIITPSAQDLINARGIDVGYRGRPLAANKNLLIALGSDHGGYQMKEFLKSILDQLGCRYRDFGTFTEEAVDYPDFAHSVARAVADGVCNLGIIVDGAGIGSCMAANKVPGVRAAMCYDEATARNSREHNYANVLTLGGKMISKDKMKEIVKTWLETPEGEARHGKRVAKIMAIEKQYLR